MKKNITKHQIDALAALLLFGVFAVCVLTVLLTGADAYRRLTDRDRNSYDRRSCTQYIATRVRQSDCLGSISIAPFGDGQALLLTEEDGYITRLYCYQGSLMELYTDGDLELEPEDGEKILALSNLELSLDGGLLTVTTDCGGERSTLLLSLRSEEGVAP